MAGTHNPTRRGFLAAARQWLSGTPETHFGLPPAKAAAALGASELLWLGPASQTYPLFASATDPQAFAINSCVNACVGEIMGGVASARFVVEKRKGKEWQPTEDSPLGTLLDYVNASEDQFALLEATSGWLSLFGNAFWRLLSANPGAKPSAIQVLPANTISVKPGQGKRSGVIAGYEMTSANGRLQFFDDTELVHFKFFGPGDPAFGASPIRVLETAINTYSAAENFNLAFYKGGGVPSALLVSEQDLTDDQVKQIQTRYQEWRAQARTDNRPLVTGKGAHLEVPGTNPDTVTVSDLPRELRKEICSVLHVPPPIVGILDEATYSNYREALRQFYRGTITQYWRRITSAVNEQLCPLFGPDMRVGFDTGHIAALQPDYVEMSTAARNLLGILRVDEIREALFDLPPWGGDWGQGAWGSITQVMVADAEGNAVGYAPPPALPAPAPQEAPAAPKRLMPRVVRQKQLRRLSGPARVALYKGFNARRDAETSRVKGPVAKWYEGLQSEVLANLAANKSLLASRVKAPAIDALLFPVDEEGRKLAARIIPVLAGLFNRTGQQALAELAVGIAFDLENPRARALLALRAQEMKTVAQTAQDRCRTALAEGLANGETIEQLTDRVMEWSATGQEYHAENVARTETGICMNEAAREGYREAGATGFEWLSIVDDRSRPEHAEMDGTVIGLDEKFVVDGVECEGAGDPALGPEGVCNCFIDGQVPIFTSEGWKPIKDITVGTKVLTHLGRFRAVTALSREPGYKGEVVRLYHNATCGEAWDRKSITVTTNHPVMTAEGWKAACDVVAGDELVTVGLPCPRCGKHSFMYHSSEYCSETCRNTATSQRQWADPAHRTNVAAKASDQMAREYASGARDPQTIAVAAREAAVAKYGPGMYFGHAGPEVRAAANAAIDAKYGSRLEFLKRFAFPALGKINGGSRLNDAMARFLRKLGWEAIPEHSVGRRRVDFYAPSEKLFIECDGWYFHQDTEAERLRDIEILQQFPDHRIAHCTYGQGDKGRPQWEYRSLETLNHEGAYGPVSVVVTKVERWQLEKARTRFNFAVEEDESYVAKGIVAHNCRCTTAPVVETADGETVEGEPVGGEE